MQRDYKKLTVEEIRNILVDSYNQKREDVDNIKGKTELVEKLKQFDTEDSTESTNSEVLQVPIDTEAKIAPNYNSPEWHDYVMTFFTENELSDGNPNIVGVRRVTGLLIGDIVCSRPVYISPSTDSMGPGRATVSWELIIERYSDKKTVIFGGVADAYMNNVRDNMFKIFVTPMAEVRAEARAFKRALGIRCVIDEETTNKTEEEIQDSLDLGKSNVPEFNNNDKVSNSVVTLIRKKCQAKGIDEQKFINSGEKKFEKLEDVDKQTASKMVERLNQFQKDPMSDAVRAQYELVKL